ELLDRHLGAEHRAAQVDEHQHAVRAADLLDRTRDGGGIGAEPAVSGPTGDRDLDLALAHLARQLADAFGELPAVRDENEANATHTPGPRSRRDGRISPRS